MKNYLFAIAFFAFSFQTTVSAITPNGKSLKKTFAKAKALGYTKPVDGYKMTDNTMFLVENGITTIMVDYMILKNGTVILINGAILTEQGSSIHLNNGESIDMNGLVSLTPAWENKNTQAVL